MGISNMDYLIFEFLKTQSHYEYREDCSEYDDAKTVLQKFKNWVERDYRPKSRQKKVHYLLQGDGTILCAPNRKSSNLHTVFKSRVTCRRCGAMLKQEEVQNMQLSEVL